MTIKDIEKLKKIKTTKDLAISCDGDFFIVTFPNGKKRNYGTLSTLLNVVSDFYGRKT